MPYIRTIPDDVAEGPLRAEHEAAIRRAGKVFNVVPLVDGLGVEDEREWS